MKNKSVEIAKFKGQLLSGRPKSVKEVAEDVTHASFSSYMSNTPSESVDGLVNEFMALKDDRMQDKGLHNNFASVTELIHDHFTDEEMGEVEGATGYNVLDLHQKLRVVRTAQAMTQEQAARLIATRPSRTCISQWETGAVDIPPHHFVSVLQFIERFTRNVPVGILDKIAETLFGGGGTNG